MGGCRARSRPALAAVGGRVDRLSLLGHGRSYVAAVSLFSTELSDSTKSLAALEHDAVSRRGFVATRSRAARTVQLASALLYGRANGRKCVSAADRCDPNMLTRV